MLERLKDATAFRCRHFKDPNVDLRDRIHLAGAVRRKNRLDRLFRQVRDRSDQDLVWHRRLSERPLDGEADQCEKRLSRDSSAKAEAGKRGFHKRRFRYGNCWKL